MKLSRVSAGRVSVACLFSIAMILATACATGPAMPFDQLLAPTETIEMGESATGEAGEGAAATKATATPVPEPTAKPAPAVDLRPTAESKYLGFMKASVAGVVREQSWYATLSPVTLELVAAIQRCEKASQARGETASVADMLKYASEQGWYTDGLDDREIKGLSAVFDAYARSLADQYGLTIGTELASTIRGALFEPVRLAESGEVIFIASAPDQATGKKLLDIAVAQAQPVEELIGKMPYRFLHFIVTDLPEDGGFVTLGSQYNEYIFLAPDAVDPSTISHEMTHATLYGIFPLWFEEGLAEFVEAYLDSSLDLTEIGFRLDLRELKSSDRLVLRATGGYEFEDDYIERAQGFLFMRDIYDIQGHEEFKASIRQMRTRSLSDVELLRALSQRGSPETQAKMKDLVCKRVIGVRAFACP